MIAVRFHHPELFGHMDLMNLGILHPLFIANRGYATTTKVNTKRTKKLEEEEESSSTMGTIQVPSKVLESQPELGATFYKNLVGRRERRVLGSHKNHLPSLHTQGKVKL